MKKFMFCPKCGKEIPEGALNCAECGAQVVKAAPAQDEVEEIVQAAAVNVDANQADSTLQEPSTESEENTYFAEASFEETPSKKVKSKKKKIVTASIIAVAVALVAVLAFNLEFLIGFFIKIFGSDEAYFKFVETKALSQSIDSITEWYGKMSETQAEGSAQGEIKLNLGDKAVDMLEESYEADTKKQIEFDWLRDIKMDIESTVKDGNADYNMDLKIGKESIMDIKMLMDMDAQEFYIGVLNLSDKYYDLSKELKKEKATAATGAGYTFLNDEDIWEVLPSKKEFRKLMLKYLKVAAGEIDNVSKSSETIEVDEISQKLTVLEFTFTEKNGMEMLGAVLKELKKDKEVKQCVKDLEKVIAEKYSDRLGPNYEEGEIYDEYRKGISEAVDRFDDLDLDEYDKELFVLTDYVNFKHEVVGRKFEIINYAREKKVEKVYGDVEEADNDYMSDMAYTSSGDYYDEDDEDYEEDYQDRNDSKKRKEKIEIFSYITVRKGKKFETETVIADDLKINGSGTEKGKVLNGDYSVELDGLSCCDLKVTDFNTKKIEKGIFSGNFKIEFTEKLIKEIYGSKGLPVSNVGLELDFKVEEGKVEYTINVLADGEMLAGFTVNAKESKPGKISMPAEKDIVKSEKEWTQTWDEEKFMETLEKAGLSEWLKSTDEQMQNEIEQIEKENSHIYSDVPIYGEIEESSYF